MAMLFHYLVQILYINVSGRKHCILRCKLPYIIFSYPAQPSYKPESASDVNNHLNDGPTQSSDVDDPPPSPLKLSPNIRCMVFPRGDITRFKPAR